MLKYLKVANVVEVPPNGMKLIKVDGLEILLINFGGRLYAYDNKCPHKGFPLFFGSLNGKILRCGFHYAEFDVTNGKSLNKVTEKPLKKIKLEVINSEIFAVVPDLDIANELQSLSKFKYHSNSDI